MICCSLHLLMLHELKLFSRHHSLRTTLLYRLTRLTLLRVTRLPRLTRCTRLTRP